MQKSSSFLRKIWLAVFTVAGWFTLLLQLYLIIENRTLSITATVVNFFSFFTVLTNILVAVCFTLLLFMPLANHFFTKRKTLAATAVYIAVVALIYNLVLRQLWKPQGWQLLADNLLHTIMPIAFVLYWIFAIPKNSLKWKHVLPWLIYPFFYLLYVLIRGAFTSLYPYPFMDVKKLGFAMVITNSCWVMVVFMAMSLLFIGLGKIISRLGSVKAN